MLCRNWAQAKSWMDGFLLGEGARSKVWKRKLESWQFTFILDSFPVHPKIEGLKTVELVFLLANGTPKTQPMDQGVIRFPKAW